MVITRSPLPHNQGKLPLPLFGGIFGQFYMILLEKITIKTIQIVTLFPHYGKLPYFSLNDQILYFQMYFQYLSFLLKYPNNVSKMGNILQFS